MALGDQSKALKIVSKKKGWDPDVIPAMTGPEGKKYPEVNIENFNKPPNTWELGDQSVGKLPEGVPDSYPKATDPVFSEKVTFDHPDVSRETKDRAANNADPYPGGGWQR